MKFFFRIWCLLLLTAWLVIPNPAAAQNVVTFEAAEIQVWPEFDHPGVLVMIDFTLAASVAVPVDVIVRIPAASSAPNAVAAASTTGELLNAPYTTTVQGENLLVKISAPSRALHIEYYDPSLKITGDQRTYSLGWQPEYPVQRATLRVQQPFGADKVTFEPALSSAGAGQYGLTYFTADLGALTAGQAVALKMSYTKSGSVLSADALNVPPPGSAAAADPQATGAPAGAAAKTQQNTPVLVGLIAGAALLVIVGIVLYFRSQSSVSDAPARSSGHRRKPRAAEPPPAPSAANPAEFCTQCGQRRSPGDRFCRKCGAPVKS